MGRRPKLKPYTIVDPDPETLGPAMLACTPLMRRLVRGYVAAGGKGMADVARAAGYSDVSEGARVRAYEATRNPKVIAAIKEECRRTFDLKAVQAIHALGDLVENSEDEKVRLSAAEKILDRTEFGPKATSHHVVEHIDHRSTTELLDFVKHLTAGPKVLQAIEGEVVEAQE